MDELSHVVEVLQPYRAGAAAGAVGIHIAPPNAGWRHQLLTMSTVACVSGVVSGTVCIVVMGLLKKN